MAMYNQLRRVRVQTHDRVSVLHYTYILCVVTLWCKWVVMRKQCNAKQREVVSGV
jgi:hypothetical protein